ncbi:MAG TPA: MaoC family dehydratase [Quisquiliibacterium sp.]|nr:MaoC family dehydratase [Quisquiliibacterium sp.]
MAETRTDRPAGDRYFEDYVVGSVHPCGRVAVDEEELIAFARRYDPQSFHVDPQAASQSFFGGLIASGWHTASLTMRLLARGYFSLASSLGSPGIDELRWLRPVRPGDVLFVRATVLESRRSSSKPDRGMVRTLVEVLDQDDEPVLTMKAMNLLRCRTAG